MSKIELVLSDITYKKQYLDLLRECEDDIKKAGFIYCIPISSEESFESDMQRLFDNYNRKNLPEGGVCKYLLANE